MAARHDFQLQCEATGEMGYHALGNMNLRWRQTVGRGHREHQRLEKLFLGAGFSMQSGIDDDPLAGESPVLGEGSRN